MFLRNAQLFSLGLVALLIGASVTWIFTPPGLAFHSGDVSTEEIYPKRPEIVSLNKSCKRIVQDAENWKIWDLTTPSGEEVCNVELQPEIAKVISESHNRDYGTQHDCKFRKAFSHDETGTDLSLNYDYDGDGDAEKNCRIVDGDHQKGICAPELAASAGEKCSDSDDCKLGSGPDWQGGADVCVLHGGTQCTWTRSDWWAPKPDDGVNNDTQTFEEYPRTDFAAGTCVSVAVWLNDTFDPPAVHMNWRAAQRVGTPHDVGLSGASLQISEAELGPPGVPQAEHQEIENLTGPSSPDPCGALTADTGTNSDISGEINVTDCVWTASPLINFTHLDPADEHDHVSEIEFRTDPTGPVTRELGDENCNNVVGCPIVASSVVAFSCKHCVQRSGE